MKKSILFVCYGLGIGGIEKCMITLLNAIDCEKYDIDVLPMNPEYDLLPYLTAKVNVLNPFDYVMNTTDTINEFKKKKYSVVNYIRYFAYRIENKFGSKPWKYFRAPDKTYDIAIAYAHIGYVPYYVIDCVSARYKYMWHHEGRYIKDNEHDLHKRYFPMFDNIIAVSKDDQKVMRDAFPEIASKIIVLYNVLNRAEIINKSREYNPNMQGKVKLVTVGRLVQQKGPDILIEAANRLKASGLEFVWYWVGDGLAREMMETLICENGLKDNIILVGNKSNPYPYMKAADIYVQPSYYEAYCTTTLEAQTLEKPIVVTDVCGMHEQFTDGIDGIIVPINGIQVANAISGLIADEKLLDSLVDNLKKKNMRKNSIINTYYELFDR